MTRTSMKMAAVLTTGVLCLVVLAGTAAADNHNTPTLFLSHYPVHLGDSCTVTADEPECTYTCGSNQKLHVSANRGSDDRASISTSCGGASADCSTTHSSCTGESWGKTNSSGNGVCQLHEGSNGSCSASN